MPAKPAKLATRARLCTAAGREGEVEALALRRVERLQLFRGFPAELLVGQLQADGLVVDLVEGEVQRPPEAAGRRDAASVAEHLDEAWQQPAREHGDRSLHLGRGLVREQVPGVAGAERRVAFGPTRPEDLEVDSK